MKADGFSNPNIISQKQDHSFQRLISLSTSDIAGTCWKWSGGNLALSQFEFYSDGTYQQTMIGTDNLISIYQGKWKISSGVVMTKLIRVKIDIHPWHTY